MSYAEMTAAQLRSKRTVCNWIIKLLRGPWADDPRAAAALAHYRAERVLIVAALRQVEGIDPPAQGVGLSSLSLSARRH